MSGQMYFRMSYAHARRPLGLRLLDLVQHRHDRIEQRRALGQLSDHALRDMGLNRADVEREAAKPFWR